MHNGGVVQTLLYAQGQRQGAVKVGDPDDRQHRHQLLAGHPGVVRLHLGYQQARGARRNGETRRRQQRSRAFTDQFFIRRSVGQADGTQGIGLLSAQQQRVKILHLLDQAVSDGGDDDQAFFGDTGQVVIEGGAADDIFGGFDEIGGFINDARRIAGASADHFFTAFHAHRHNARAAGDSQNGNQRVGHHLLGGFKGRLGNGHHQVTDPAAAVGDLFDPGDKLQRDLFRAGMGAEIDAVTRRQHADTVVDNGFRWVGAGRHGANNPERRVLKQHHPAIAGEGAGSEILYARRVFKSGFIFQIFIFFVAHAGFRGALFRQRRQLGGQRLPQGADNGAAGF